MVATSGAFGPLWRSLSLRHPVNTCRGAHGSKLTRRA